MKLVAEFRIEALVRLGDGFRVRGVLRLERPASSTIACAEVYGTPDHENPGSAGPRVGEGMRHTVWHECERADIDAVTCVAKNELHGCARSQATPRRSFGGYAAPVPARRGRTALIDGEVALPGLDFDRSVGHRNPELPSLPRPENDWLGSHQRHS